MARECGECQLCCELIGVDELAKYPHQRCKHQCATGCAIHNARPRECRTYQCLWRSGETIAQELRPDRLGCIVDLHETILGPAIVVHQRYQDQWQEPHVSELLAQLSKQYGAWIYTIHDKNRQTLFPEWTKERQSQFDAMAKSGTVPELCGRSMHPDNEASPQCSN